jgi:hypothetical protein
MSDQLNGGKMPHSGLSSLSDATRVEVMKLEGSKSMVKEVGLRGGELVEK